MEPDALWMVRPAPVWTAGAPVGMPVLLRAVPTMDDVLEALHLAHVQLSLQCAVASLGHYIPEVRRLPGFEELHRENYDVSYHLTTAIGAARRILSGARDPGYFALVVTCQREAFEHQQRAMAAFRRMAESAPADVRPLLQRLGGHTHATRGHMQTAAGITMAALGPEVIAELVRWTEATPHR